LLGFIVKRVGLNKAKLIQLQSKRKEKGNPSAESQLVPNQMDAKQFCQKGGNVHGYNPNNNTMPKFWSCQNFGWAS
jgi:hypothetical protein